MPVLPLVGSMMTVSLVSVPLFSASSIIAMPMRSFTLESGLKNSHLSSTVASMPSVTLLSRTNGVRPTVSTMSLNILAIFVINSRHRAALALVGWGDYFLAAACLRLR